MMNLISHVVELRWNRPFKQYQKQVSRFEMNST